MSYYVSLSSQGIRIFYLGTWPTNILMVSESGWSGDDEDDDADDEWGVVLPLDCPTFDRSTLASLVTFDSSLVVIMPALRSSVGLKRVQVLQSKGLVIGSSQTFLPVTDGTVNYDDIKVFAKNLGWRRPINYKNFDLGFFLSSQEKN